MYAILFTYEFVFSFFLIVQYAIKIAAWKRALSQRNEHCELQARTVFVFAWMHIRALYVS